MKHRFCLAFPFFAGGVCLLAAASAQEVEPPEDAYFRNEIQVCRDADLLIERLAAEYGEVPMGTLGQRLGGNSTIEVYANTETGTFSVLDVTPEGAACVLGAGVGESWDE